MQLSVHMDGDGSMGVFQWILGLPSKPMGFGRCRGYVSASLDKMPQEVLIHALQLHNTNNPRNGLEKFFQLTIFCY